MHRKEEQERITTKHITPGVPSLTFPLAGCDNKQGIYGQGLSTAARSGEIRRQWERRQGRTGGGGRGHIVRWGSLVVFDADGTGLTGAATLYSLVASAAITVTPVPCQTRIFFRCQPTAEEAHHHCCCSKGVSPTSKCSSQQVVGELYKVSQAKSFAQAARSLAFCRCRK